MRSEREFQLVRELVVDGLNDCEIARQTSIPRSTIRGWRHGTQRVMGTRDYDWALLDPAEYVYLLGLYLGDGHITRMRGAVHRLRVSLDARHPAIIDECAAMMASVMPTSRVHRVSAPGCVVIGSYANHWITLFPQHGPGKKHARPIVLELWQQAVVEAHPYALLRGLIHSDGSRFMNRVRVGGKAYAYPRYNFTNHSADIRGLFTDACDRLGIAWRQMNAVNVSVARREAVAALDAFVGPKR